MINMSATKNNERNKIIIGKPYVEDYLEDRARLCAEVTIKEKKVLYFEVDKEYKKYLCKDRQDAFLLGLLHSAMFDDLDIECEGVISEQLLFQLNTYYIPIISERMKDLHFISVSAKTTNELVKTENGVGTGLSGGIDSLYTTIKYSNENMGANKLTHLLFNNIFTADVDDNRIREQHNKDVIEKKEIATKMGLSFIDVYSNLYDFYTHPGIFNHYYTMQYASVAYALAHLFGVYYFSSGLTLDFFTVDFNKIPDGSAFDLFSLSCASTKALQFYSAGVETTRYDKTKYLAGNKICQSHLQVCGAPQDYGGSKQIAKLNCGKCTKCERTMLSLEILGELDNYESVFDFTLYKANKNKFIGRYLAADHGELAKEIELNLKKQNKLKSSVKFWKFMFKIRFKLAKNKTLVKLIKGKKYDKNNEFYYNPHQKK